MVFVSKVNKIQNINQPKSTNKNNKYLGSRMSFLSWSACYSSLNKVKKLKQGKKSFDKGGRNSQGSITVFHRGGRNKRLYRLIDFKRSLFRESSFSEETVVKKGQDSKISNQNTSSEKTREGIVIKIDYDPNRTAAVAMICYSDGVLSYILCPKDLQVGDKVSSGCVAPINKGNALPIENIPVGTLIHNIEIKPGKGGQLVRAAGAYAKIVKKETKHVVIRFNSGKVYNIPLKCMATIGVVSNELHKNKKLAKAGSKRWKGIRPTVRGVAMNPIDHPHGGGEGRSKGGRHPSTPWGKLTKGKPTSFLKKTTNRKFKRNR